MQAHGLHEYNVLDYFSQSQFYDTSCINEQIKMQARFNLLEANLLDHTKMVGFEYDLWYFTYQPSYFIIRKHQRYSPQKTELVAIYYIVEGTIYQSPSLSTLLTNRVLTSTFFLTKAFEVGKDNSRFHPVQGYRWVTDEPAIQESRKELVERADQGFTTTTFSIEF
ncbi:MED6 mediator sub complex component-domain-containing protein [Globomyces pollinis-pini]|nr:MED6 mediator sub complex component-domain-containing protein [Globomyces pollinis-pini]